MERSLLRDCAVMVGMDEVGRGALAGPVAVGAVVVTADTGRPPAGVRDSKELRPGAREALVGPIRRWAAATGVGMASAAEIDDIGIIAALGRAGARALRQVGGIDVDVVLLDGNHDWLSPQLSTVNAHVPQVMTVVRGDGRCTSVAAASVLAKVARDALMVSLHDEHPHYGWDSNKGYSAAAHRSGLLARGPCDLHRRSWRLMDGAGAGPATQQVSSGPRGRVGSHA
jgi:ribonuclease HII